MRKSYDFSKGTKNPYAKRVKKQVTIRLDETTIDYFKKLAEDLSVPYQTLINMYLHDCAASGRKLAVKWIPAAQVRPTRLCSRPASPAAKCYVMR